MDNTKFLGFFPTLTDEELQQISDTKITKVFLDYAAPKTSAEEINKQIANNLPKIKNLESLTIDAKKLDLPLLLDVVSRSQISHLELEHITLSREDALNIVKKLPNLLHLKTIDFCNVKFEMDAVGILAEAEQELKASNIKILFHDRDSMRNKFSTPKEVVSIVEEAYEIEREIRELRISDRRFLRAHSEAIQNKKAYPIEISSTAERHLSFVDDRNDNGVFKKVDSLRTLIQDTVPRIAANRKFLDEYRAQSQPIMSSSAIPNAPRNHPIVMSDPVEREELEDIHDLPGLVRGRDKHVAPTIRSRIIEDDEDAVRIAEQKPASKVATKERWFSKKVIPDDMSSPVVNLATSAAKNSKPSAAPSAAGDEERAFYKRALTGDKQKTRQ